MDSPSLARLISAGQSVIATLEALSPIPRRRNPPDKPALDPTWYNIVHVGCENVTNGLAMVVAAVASAIIVGLGAIAVIFASLLGALCGRVTVIDPNDILKPEAISHIVKKIFESAKPVQWYLHEGVDYIFLRLGHWNNKKGAA